MDGYRCPRCSALSYPGLMGFPRCHRCHEQLRQCRYCTHESGGLCTLDETARGRLLQEDGRPYCRAFASRLVVTGDEDRFGRALLNPAWPTALLTAAVILLAALIAWAAGREALHPQLAAREALVTLREGRVAPTFLLSAPPNWSRQPRPVFIQVEPGLAPYYLVERIEPVPAAESTGGPKEVRYDLVSGQTMMIRLRLVRGQIDPPPEMPVILSVLAGPDNRVSSARTLIRAGRAPRPPTAPAPPPPP